MDDEPRNPWVGITGIPGKDPFTLIFEAVEKSNRRRFVWAVIVRLSATGTLVLFLWQLRQEIRRQSEELNWLEKALRPQ